jgi:hypothetical protein
MSKDNKSRKNTQNKINLNKIPTLTITQQKTIFNGLEQFEVVNRSIINKLQKSELLRDEVYEENDIRKFSSEREFIETYKFGIENGMRKVKYYIHEIGFGRVYPTNALSLGLFRSEIRHTIAKDKYIDIDIVNCHPVILEQILNKNNIKSPCLTRYVKEREKILDDTMKYYKINDRKIVKNLYIRLMYEGSYEFWAKENNINKKEMTFIRDFSEEIKNISEIIVKHNKELEAKVIALKKNENKEYKRSNTVSYYLQEYERRILEIIYQYLVKNKYINQDAILCFDGIMIMREKYKEEILKELSNEIYNKIGFELKLEVKEMDRDYLEKIKDIEIIDSKTALYFDRKYINTLKSYDEVKEYFEYFVCKIDFPPNYIFFERGDKRFNTEKFQSIMDKNELEKIFIDLKYMEIDKDNVLIEKKFIIKWIDDQNKRVSKKMDFIPKNAVNIASDNFMYNLFGGWNEKILTKYDKDKHDKFMKPFLDLGLELCGGNKIYFDYLLNFFAHMIQYPEKRIPISIIIKGKQGTGKNVFLNAIGNLMDSNNYISSSNPNDFFGEYAEGFYHKILINMNECEGRDTFVFEGKLKSFISEAKIRMNPKFMRPVDINNYARLIIFSNKSTPIPIDVKSKDRRYVVFQTTDKYLDKKYSALYWSRLIEHFNRPEFIASLYNELNNRDISEWNFIKERPITDAYREMCKNFIPIEALYFEDIIKTNMYQTLECNKETDSIDNINGIEDKREIKIKGTKLYDNYIDWCKKYNFIKDMTPNIRSFNLKLKELEFPIFSVTFEGSARYKLIPEKIYKMLCNKKWIMDDSFIEDEIEIVDEVFIDDTFNV